MLNTEMRYSTVWLKLNGTYWKSTSRPWFMYDDQNYFNIEQVISTFPSRFSSSSFEKSYWSLSWYTFKVQHNKPYASKGPSRTGLAGEARPPSEWERRSYKTQPYCTINLNVTFFRMSFCPYAPHGLALPCRPRGDMKISDRSPP